MGEIIEIYMGLDMYLEKRHYIGNKHRKPEERVTTSHPDVRTERLHELTEQVAYWRKANAIHRWFVENVQDDVDDCKEYYVTYEQLRDLLHLVKKILADHSLAAELLPTQAGFFFGNTEYDKDYFDDLETTAEQLRNVLEEPDAPTADYYYQSSW
jgi:hypothetical protein